MEQDEIITRKILSSLFKNIMLSMKQYLTSVTVNQLQL